MSSWIVTMDNQFYILKTLERNVFLPIGNIIEITMTRIIIYM